MVLCHLKVLKYVFLGMGNIEILCCDNHPLKYQYYCKYHNIQLVGYNSAIKLIHKHTVECYTMYQEILTFLKSILYNLYAIDNISQE